MPPKINSKILGKLPCIKIVSALDEHDRFMRNFIAEKFLASDVTQLPSVWESWGANNDSNNLGPTIMEDHKFLIVSRALNLMEAGY